MVPIEWTKEFPKNIDSAKDIEVLPSSGNVAVMLWSETLPVGFAVLKNNDGRTLWSKQYPQAMAEPTDMVVHASAGNEYIAMTGNAYVTPSGLEKGISGRVMKIEAESGNFLWAKSYSAGGNPDLIFNECWGIAALAGDGGYVLGCGTGIEMCDNFRSGSQLRKKCNAGKGDERPGAYPRKPGVWQSMVVRTDINGELQWQRVDSFKSDSALNIGEAGWEQEATSSASEWILLDTAENGKQRILSLNDEVFGVGLLALDEDGVATTGKPTTADPATTQPTIAQPATMRPTAVRPVTPSQVILMGDSWAEFAGTSTLQRICTDSSVRNIGVSGSTAAQWASSTCPQSNNPCCDGRENRCDISSLFQNIEDDVTVVISLGGNDFLERQCKLNNQEIATLENDLKSVVEQVKRRAPRAKIVVYGYPKPSEDAECPGSNPGKIAEKINNIISPAYRSIASDIVQIITPTNFFGSGTFSNRKYFVDAIHLNPAGYSLLFSSSKAEICYTKSVDPVSPIPEPTRPTNAPTNEPTMIRDSDDNDEDGYDEGSAGDDDYYEYDYDEQRKRSSTPQLESNPDGKSTETAAWIGAGVGVFALAAVVGVWAKKRGGASAETATDAIGHSIMV